MLEAFLPATPSCMYDLVSSIGISLTLDHWEKLKAAVPHITEKMIPVSVLISTEPHCMSELILLSLEV